MIRNSEPNLGLSETYCDYNCTDCSYCNSFIHARKIAAGRPMHSKYNINYCTILLGFLNVCSLVSFL